VAGLATVFGSGAMTNSIDEIAGAACILAIGTNTTHTHPVASLKVKEAVRRGASLIVVNPKRIELCRYADLWLQLRSGTDVALLMGMMRIIADEGLADLSFIEERCEGFGAFRESLRDYDLDTVESITGVPRKKIEEAARLYATTKPASILYCLGITEHSHGTENVFTIGDLAMLTGNVGKRSAGVNPLRGQNNVQGACDMGCLPDVFPGYQKVGNPEARQKFETAWGCCLSATPGLTLTEMFDGAGEGSVKALYLVGEDPVLTEANAHHVAKALQRAEFLVVQDLFLTETAKLADVVLPAACYAEKDGTFTNTERRFQRVRKAVDPPGDAWADWRILCQVARTMGADGFEFQHPSEIMAEMASLSPAFGGLSFDRLEKGGIQWPCPSSDHPGTPFLHSQRFSTPSGKGRFLPVAYRPSAELPDEEYPLILSTDRSLYHYHVGSMTRRVKGLTILKGEDMVDISPEDAAALGIQEGEMVRVVSRRGAVAIRARVTSDCPSGFVSMTFHFSETPTNVLTNPALDPISKTPEFKVSAVRVEKL